MTNEEEIMKMLEDRPKVKNAKSVKKGIYGALAWAAATFLVPFVADKTGMPAPVAGSAIFGVGAIVRNQLKMRLGLKWL